MIDRPILVLDQSLENTGFALFADNALAMSGSWHLADGAKNRSIGFVELFRKLGGMHKGHGIGHIVHEAPAFGTVNKGANQLVAAAGLVAVIELFSKSRGLPDPISYSPRSWRTSWFMKVERKAIAAKPQRSRDWKRPALERARQYGFDPVSHDEAEAIAILHHHLIVSGVQPPWTDGGKVVEPLYGLEDCPT